MVLVILCDGLNIWQHHKKIANNVGVVSIKDYVALSTILFCMVLSDIGLASSFLMDWGLKICRISKMQGICKEK